MILDSSSFISRLWGSSILVDFKVVNRVVSSAYIVNLKRSLEDVISLIYIINKRGPNVEPWGTPSSMGCI